jgi:hypothetical protein
LSQTQLEAASSQRSELDVAFGAAQENLQQERSRIAALEVGKGVRGGPAGMRMAPCAPLGACVLDSRVARIPTLWFSPF